MALELNLRFMGADQVQVRLDDEDSGTRTFVNPFTPKDRQDIAWYVETYAAHSLGDPDDAEAKRVKERLPQLGRALFDAVFTDRAAQRLFNRFQDAEDESRLLTVAAEDASVLSLPWELLHDSAPGGVFLFRESPQISIRRRLAGGTGGRKPLTVETKDKLHLLFVVSRPAGAGFLDPRADAAAVLEALDAHAPGRVTCEFLRPATLERLKERLEDRDRPPIDILHFDGHGVFDAAGTLAEHRAASDVVRERSHLAPRDEPSATDAATPSAPHPERDGNAMGYLLFETADGQKDFVSATALGENLHRKKVGLVILSACQTAMLPNGGDPFASVAARLAAAGLPAVLAMTHSVLVHTTRSLFGEFYRHLAHGRRIGESLDRARGWLRDNPFKYDVQRGPERRPLELHDWFLPALYQGGEDIPRLRRYETPPVARGGRRPRVFLSHSSVDKPAATRLAESLGIHGLDVWIDQGEIRTGDSISAKIEAGLRECDFLLALLSRSSVASEWVQREIHSRLAHDAAHGRSTILPVRLDDCEIPSLLADVLHADLREDYARGVSRIVAAIRRAVPSDAADGPDRSVGSDRTPFDGRVPARPETGFFGRRRELWDIECWFAGPTRRISLCGFGGQGKTELAAEAGRWLVRAGLFQHAVFVNYARIQADDAVSVAISHLSARLGRSLANDADVAAALTEMPTLLILDNLEALAAEPLQLLLTAASRWSQCAGSRVLLTSRTPDFQHADYCVTGTHQHRRILLDGLGDAARPDDALEWFALLSKLPPPSQLALPTRKELIDLFAQVRFHPLSIRVLAQQLKTRQPAELGQRLEHLVARPSQAVSLATNDETAWEGRVTAEDTPDTLLASLLLSFDRLTDAERDAVRALGVFQGGAMEPELVAITGLGEPAGWLRRVFDRVWRFVTRRPYNPWPRFRQQLEAAALIEAETIPGVVSPYLRFHPTLAPLLWSQLDAESRARLSEAHRRRYYALSGYLYYADDETPREARAIAWRELPNLLHAVHRALDAADPDAVDFVNMVNRFLTVYGLTREAAKLTHRAEQAAGESGSHSWFLAQSNKGERLRTSGQVAAAAELFSSLLATAGDRPTYERAVTLSRLGICYRAGGRPDLAEACYRDGIAVTEKLEPSDRVKRHQGVLHTDLGDVLTDHGQFAEARLNYEVSLAIKKEFGGDHRGEGVVHAQLGTLAMAEGKLDEALRRYREALVLFQRLREPATEAIVWHQLGMVFDEAQQWNEAERHYREAARIREAIGNLAASAQTWNNLAAVTHNAGKPDAAENWYRKAIEGFRAVGDEVSPSKCLNNLADLLRTQPHRLAEAWQLAEEALAIKRSLDPGAAEIWKTYGLLAEIADQEAAATTDTLHQAALQQSAAAYRRQARDAKRNFAGTRYELQRHASLILVSFAACHGDPAAPPLVARYQSAMRQAGPDTSRLADTLDRLLAGERNADSLCADLRYDAAMVVETILTALADPTTLSDLRPGPEKGQALQSSILGG